MKRVAFVLAICSCLAIAQQAPQGARTNLAERAMAPSYSDLYCSGYLSKQAPAAGNVIVAALESPDTTQYATGDTVFLEGSGYQEGSRYTVVRALKDSNKRAAFPGQAAAISAAGQPYAELGRVRVTAMRGKIAVGVVEFACEVIAPGDAVVPFQEKSPVAYRPKTKFEVFPGETGVAARIVMAKDFDTVVATGQKVYLNIGADKGVKPGDYFRVVHNYDPLKMEPVEALSFKAPQSEDTQKYAVRVPPGKYAELPRHAVAEIIVLAVTPTSATGMITYAEQSVNVGDTVEMEGGTAGGGGAK
ncbi:MAG: hypothetical protein ACR2IF_01825 [Terriglobales bacterium]